MAHYTALLTNSTTPALLTTAAAEGCSAFRGRRENDTAAVTERELK